MDSNIILDAKNDCYEFILLEDSIKLVYENKTWFVEIDDENIEDDIIIIESEELDIYFNDKDEIDLWNKYILKKEEFEEIKSIVDNFVIEEEVG